MAVTPLKWLQNSFHFMKSGRRKPVKATMSDASVTDNSSTHHGFSQKARGILLHPEHPVVEKVPSDRRTPSPVAPHRGFSEKAREVLLNAKTVEQGSEPSLKTTSRSKNSSLPFRIKGGDKINQIA